MLQGMRNRLGHAVAWLGHWLRKPELMVFLPAVTLAAFWIGGERVLLMVALGLPLLFLLAGAFRFHEPPPPALIEGYNGLAFRPQMIAQLDRILRDAPVTGRNTACLVLQFDDADLMLDRHGRAAQTEMIARSAERICAALREGDIVARLEGGGLAVALAAQRRLDLEGLVQMAARLQAAISPPISIDAARHYVSCSIGFCLGAQLADASGAALLDAAQVAADEALRNGPGALRGFSTEMPRKRADREALRAMLEHALDTGEIRAHFQPQLCTDTGAVSGFEALARWHHPERGIVPPIGESATCGLRGAG